MLQFTPIGGYNGFGLGDTKDDAITLQLAANRYAASVGKTPLKTDGDVGSLTLALVRAALAWIPSQPIAGTGPAAQAQMLLAQLTTATALKTNANLVSSLLNSTMDTIRLSAINPPPPPEWSKPPSSLLTNLLTSATSYTVQPPGGTPGTGTQPGAGMQPGQIPGPGGLVPGGAGAGAAINAGSITLPTGPGASILGLTPKAQKYLLWGGGIAIGLYALKKLI
jgi:hypothetical protein